MASLKRFLWGIAALSTLVLGACQTTRTPDTAGFAKVEAGDWGGVMGNAFFVNTPWLSSSPIEIEVTIWFTDAPTDAPTPPKKKKPIYQLRYGQPLFVPPGKYLPSMFVRMVGSGAYMQIPTTFPVVEESGEESQVAAPRFFTVEAGRVTYIGDFELPIPNHDSLIPTIQRHDRMAAAQKALRDRHPNKDPLPMRKELVPLDDASLEAHVQAAAGRPVRVVRTAPLMNW